MDKQKRILGIRQSAILEILIMLLVIVVLDWLVAAGGPRFRDVQPHPCWIIVLLINAKYGTSAGLLATLVSTIYLLLGNMPDQQVEQDIWSYLFSVALTPILWLIATLFLGEIRHIHIRERDRLARELDDSKIREEDIANSYNRLKGLKESLELRIAGQFRNTIDTYRAAKAIERLHPVDVLNGIEELVRAVMNPEKFSVYTLDQNGLTATITNGWSTGDLHSRQFSPNSAIYNEIIGRQHTICVANSDQQRILGDEGMLAGPLVYAETGEVLGMLKIEKLGFLDLNLSTIETFSAICEWIGMALVNARNYQKVKADSVINPEHNLLSENYFRRYTDHISTLAKRVGFDVSMIVVRIINAANLGDEARRQIAGKLSETVQQTLRNVDLAFDYHPSGEEYAIVLPSTNVEGAQIVLDKIIKELQERARRIDKNAQFSCKVHSLNQK